MKKNLKRALSVLLVCAMVLTTCVFAGMPLKGLFAPKAEAAYSGQLKVDENGDFTILQIADVQGCYPLPDQWINTIKLAVSTAEPDLIVMTGDNVVNNEYSEGVWHTLDQIVREFYYIDHDGNKVLIPFAMTFGNHDTESNGHDWSSQDYYKYCLNGTYDNGAKNRTVANGKKGYYSDNEDFSGYNNFVDYDKSSTISGLTTMGTGYIDIYSNDGSKVVERVILLNSGTYDDNGGYGKPGYNTKSSYNNDTAYNNVVAKVNDWTNATNSAGEPIKCIGFQHIPFREFYKGDSASTSILTRSASQANASYIKGYGDVGDSTINTGWYAPNTSNSTVKGVYSETCCASHGDTSALYNAYAKDNVYGVFFGHDHGNTLSGVATVDGSTLRMGYGGGINTEYNGAGVSAFSYYKLNTNYSGPTDTKNFKKTDNDYSSYINLIGASYGPKTYAPDSTNYICELGLEYAPHSIIQQRTFERAVKNLGSSYTPLLHMYNDAGANADLNRSTGSSTDDVCIGYKTNNNPAEAITGIIGYRTESDNHPNQITVTLQNGYDVTYFLDSNDVDCSGGISDYYTLVYYTRDPIAGPPITNLYMTYDSDGIPVGDNKYTSHDNGWSKFNMNQGETIGDYKVCSWLSDDLTHLQEWRAFDFNTGCGGGTDYLYLEYASHGTEDVTRAYYDILNAYNDYGKVYDSNNERYTETSYRAYDAKRREVEAFIATLQKPYSPETSAQIYHSREVLIEAYNNLVPKTDGKGRQVKSNDDITPHYHLAVPETIYLAPDASAATTGQYYVNNKLDSDNKLVCDGTYSETGKFELSCPNCVNVSVNVVRMTGTTFNIDGTTGYNRDGNLVVKGNITTGTRSEGNTDVVYSYAAAVAPDSNGKIAGTITWTNLGSGNGISSGGTSLLEWRFTVTRANNTEETVYAYTVLYAPFIKSVAAISAGTARETGWSSAATWSAIFGIHEILPGPIGTINITGSNAYNAGSTLDATCEYKYNLTNHSTTPNDYPGGDAPTTSNILASVDTNSDGAYVNYSSTKGAAYWYKGTGDTDGKHVHGGLGKVYYDSSRETKISDIPNFYYHTYMSSFRHDGTDDYTKDETNWTHWYMVNSSNAIQNVEVNNTKFIKNFSGRVETVSNNSGVANFALGDGYRFYIISERFWRQRNWVGTHESTEIWAATGVQFKATNKGAMREDIGYYESLSPQRDWYSTDNEFNPFMNALIAACLNLGNPASSSNSTTELSTKYNSFLNNQDRGGSITVDGVTYTYPMYYTVEQNFGLKCTYDGYAQTGYIVEPIIVDRFEFYGNSSNGLRSMDTVFVKPYNLEEDNYYYQGWMDGEGFDPLYGRDPSALTDADKGVVPKLGDTFKFAYMGNLYDDFNVYNQVNYGHITAEEMYRGLNEFYFYYHKGNDFRTLYFDLNGVGATMTVGATTYTSGGTQYSVKGYEDDEFQIRLQPARSGYVFDGWELASGSSGTYNDANTTYTYGTANGTLKAKWLRITDLVMNSDGGITANNLIYFYKGKDYADFSNPNFSASATYEDDSDVTITGNITATGSEITPWLDNKLVVYLVKGHTYQLSFDCTNFNMDFYAYKKGTDMECRSGRMKNYNLDPRGNYIQNADGTYSCTATFTVGGTGTDGTDRTWNNSTYNNDTYILTDEYNFRISISSAQASGAYTIKNLRIVEVDTSPTEDMSLQKTDDNKISQLEGTTRMIQNPPQRCDEWIFGGYEVYVDSNDDDSFAASEYVGSTENPDTVRDYIYYNSSGCYTFKYQHNHVKLKTIWIKPLGLALDNMFNFYEFRYNETSAKLSGSGKTDGDTLNFDNTDQSINVKDDGTPKDSSYDVYTSYGNGEGYYKMPLRKYVDEDGNEKTAAYYLLTMDVTVSGGTGQYFVFGYGPNSSDVVLAYERPISESKHIEKIISVDPSVYTSLEMRLGFYAQNSNVTFKNIRLVPMNAAVVADDTLGYADKTQDPVTPVTHTYHITKSGTIAEYFDDYTAGNTSKNPERNGYSFVGWADAQGNFVNGGASADINYTLFSQWSADQYVLNYDANTEDEVANMPENDAEDAPSPTTWALIYDNTNKAAVDGIVSDAIPTDSDDANQIFIGWNTKNDGTGDTYYPGVLVQRATIDGWYADAKAAAAASETPIDRTITLYAQWYDVSEATDDYNKKDSDYKQYECDVVRGVNVDADGKYTSTIKDTKVSKFDTTKYSKYTTATTAFNTAKTNVTNSVNATNVEALKTGNINLINAANELENTANQSNVVANYYADKFVVKQNGVEKTYQLEDMNLNHYATSTLSSASTARTNGKTYAYSTGTTLRKAFDTVSGNTAQAMVNSAVETMAKAFVSQTKLDVKPTYKVYETPQAVKAALGSNADVDAVNYVFTSYSGYTYYCYTNKLNPKIAISIDDLDPNNTGRVCYPTTAEKADGSSSAVLFEKKNVENSTYDTYLQNGLGTKMTASNANYYKEKTVIKMEPTFTANNQEVVYKFTAHDDAYAGVDGTDYNYAANAALSGGISTPHNVDQKEESAKTINSDNEPNSIAELSTKRTTDTKNPANGISIVVCYKNDDNFYVYADDNMQWGNHDLWLNKVHLYRSSGGASNSQMVDRIGGATGSHKEYYTVVDPDFGQTNYGSFLYVFNDGADSTTNCTINLSGCSTDEQKLAKAKAFFKTHSVADVPVFSQKNTGGTGLGYLRWLGSEWSIGFYPQGNAYVYVHLVDRWGNVAEFFDQFPSLDYGSAKSETTSAGSVTITEEGGSGLDTVSLNTSSMQIITGDESTLEDNVYKTSGNSVLVYTGEPNKSYNIAMADRATNSSTGTVKSDADGYVLMTFEDLEYKNGVYTFSLNDYEINLYDGVEQEPEVKGTVVDVQYEAVVGTSNTYNVKVEDRANMLQFIELDHGDGTGTRSFDRYDDRVTIVSYDAEGNVADSTDMNLAYEIWTVTTPLADGNIGVRVKKSGSPLWEDKALAYNFTNEYAKVESGLVSAALAKTEGAKGPVKFTVVTGADVKSVQLKNQEGGTVTVKADKATANEDGTLTFTGSVWFHGAGERTAAVRILDAYGWKDAETLTYTINK